MKQKHFDFLMGMVLVFFIGLIIFSPEAFEDSQVREARQSNKNEMYQIPL